jgi:uncharacterized protein (TIGR03067 family)
MRRSALLLLLLAAVASLAFAPAPLPKPDPTKADWQKLQGKWVRLSFTVGGQPMQMKDTTTVVFSGNRLKYTGPTMSTHEWSINLDAKKKPKVLDMTGVQGGEKGVTYWGIYRLEGDTLTVCGFKGTNDSARPRDFNGFKPGVLIEIFKRLKD